jgi:RNA polymerase sigma-70 factor (ECF subfamily)
LDGKNGSDVIQRAKQGEQDAMRQLYETTKNYAWFIARRYLQNDEDIADVLQDAYASVFSNLDQFKTGRSFKPWLYAIVSRKCLKFIKKRRAIELTLDDIDKYVADADEMMPAEWLEQSEKRKEVLRIIDGLPESQRIAITLFYFEDLKINEIAETMGVAAGTVRAHLFYGRKKIKEEIIADDSLKDFLRQSSVGPSLPVPLVPLLTQLYDLEAEATVMPEELSEGVWTKALSNLSARKAAAAKAAKKQNGIAAKVAALFGKIKPNRNRSGKQ